jgi:hypothetical protein
MTEPQTSQDPINKALFTQLIVMLATSAIQQLGKLVNPVTKNAEVDLEGAQAAIDLLDMIEAKTKGNLDKDEERMIRETIMSVKMNFVQTKESTSGTQPAASEPHAPPQPPPSPDTAAGKKDAEGNEPRFHKKYG